MRDKIVQAALSYEGTRWRHQGRQPGVGLDCAGVLVCAYRSAGLSINDDPSYARLPDPKRMRSYLEENSKPINFEDALPGDFIWLRYDDPQHLAILVGDFSIVHGFMRLKKVVRQKLDKVTLSRLVQTYRHRELLDE